MSNKPYTTLQRLTIEALDCIIKPPNYDSQGHLQVFIEPRIPFESLQRNADPLLSQTTGQQKDTLSATAVSSTSPTSELPVLTDTITSQTDTTLPHLEDTMTSPTITSPYSLSEDTDIAQYFSTSGDDIEKVTPVPDNKVPENNDTPNEPSTLPLQQNTRQTQTVEDNSDLDMSEYMKCSRFQEKLKSLKTKLSKEFSDTIAKHPEHIRNLIFQILNTYPDILDDKSGPILEYIKTDVGNIPIIQPLYETISEPDTTQTDSVHQEDGTTHRQWIAKWADLKFNPDTDNIDEFIAHFEDLASLNNIQDDYKLHAFKIAMPKEVELHLSRINNLQDCYQTAKELLTIVQSTVTNKMSALSLAQSRSPSPEPTSKSPSPVRPPPHRFRSRTQAIFHGSNRRPPFRCFNCHKLGHFARNCFTQPRVRFQDELVKVQIVKGIKHLMATAAQICHKIKIPIHILIHSKMNTVMKRKTILKNTMMKMKTILQNIMVKMKIVLKKGSKVHLNKRGDYPPKFHLKIYLRLHIVH